jgi:hypothetical protein
MVDFDENPNVIEWSSEEISIKYHNPLKTPVTGRLSRYFPDFLIKVKDREDNIRRILIEVKPKKETAPPTPPKRKSRKFIKETATWQINDAKWKAARLFCENNGIEFQIVTEDHIFGKKHK